jgi:hypothetical protein
VENADYSDYIMCISRLLCVLNTFGCIITGLMTGIGTIDRLKKKAMDTMLQSEEEPIPLKDVFGIAGYHTWFLPIDPVFEDYDRVMGFSTPQRLLREQIKEPNNNDDNYNSGNSVYSQSTAENLQHRHPQGSSQQDLLA